MLQCSCAYSGKGLEILFRIKNDNGGIVGGLDLPNESIFDVPFTPNLTNKQSNEVKVLLTDKTISRLYSIINVLILFQNIQNGIIRQFFIRTKVLSASLIEQHRFSFFIVIFWQTRVCLFVKPFSRQEEHTVSDVLFCCFFQLLLCR